MTLDVVWNRVFGPAPISKGLRKEFEPAARRGKATLDFTIHPDTDKAPPFSVAVRAGNWHDIRRSRFGRAREHAAKVTFANIFEFFSGDRLLMNRANLLCDFERAISAHEFEWP